MLRDEGVLAAWLSDSGMALVIAIEGASKGKS